MNFLKKLGLLLAKGADVTSEILGYGPIISIVAGILPKRAGEIVQTGISDLTLIAKEVITAEKMLTAISGPDVKTGSQKLTAAAPGIALLMDQWATSGVLGSIKCKDHAKADAAVKGITANMADFLSAYGD